jgi:hypothetical protein
MHYRKSFPDLWMKPSIMPIYKKGNKILPENYRPKALLNTVGKLFEKKIFSSICIIMFWGTLF